MSLAIVLSLSEEGFAYESDHRREGFLKRLLKRRRQGFIKWSEVESVSAYKRDLLTFASICVAVSPHSGGEPVEIDEDDLHWKALLEAFSQHLRGIEPSGEWFSKVAFPPFATNWRQLYQHAKNSNSAASPNDPGLLDSLVQISAGRPHAV